MKLSKHVPSEQDFIEGYAVLVNNMGSDEEIHSYVAGNNIHRLVKKYPYFKDLNLPLRKLKDLLEEGGYHRNITHIGITHNTRHLPRHIMSLVIDDLPPAGSPYVYFIFQGRNGESYIEWTKFSMEEIEDTVVSCSIDYMVPSINTVDDGTSAYNGDYEFPVRVDHGDDLSLFLDDTAKQILTLKHEASQRLIANAVEYYLTTYTPGEEVAIAFRKLASQLTDYRNSLEKLGVADNTYFNIELDGRDELVWSNENKFIWTPIRSIVNAVTGETAIALPKGRLAFFLEEVPEAHDCSSSILHFIPVSGETPTGVMDTSTSTTYIEYRNQENYDDL